VTSEKPPKQFAASGAISASSLAIPNELPKEFWEWLLALFT
jgi:hypothetical protein